MKVALVSIGLGHILRGFEAFTRSLFHALRQQAPSLEVTLFQGRGRAADQQVVIPHFPRGDTHAILLQQRSFALFLYPWLRRGGYEIVHYNELVMGSALFHLRRYFGGKFKLLYCNGAPSPPVHYHHRCDFAQMLTGPMYEEARDFGLLPERLFLLPYGLDRQRFTPQTKARRSETRGELGIPEKAKVVLTVAALKREHKRLDYLIKEAAALDEPVWLLAAGQRTEDTPFLEEEAQRLLPGRWRFVSWPHDRVPLLYGSADVFALASLSEAFGLVTVEALLSGLPVVVHNTPANRWIMNGQSNGLIDMSKNENLAQELRKLLFHQVPCSYPTEAAGRFSWEMLLAEYIKMYQKVAQLHLPGSVHEL